MNPTVVRWQLRLLCTGNAFTSRDRMPVYPARQQRRSCEKCVMGEELRIPELFLLLVNLSWIPHFLNWTGRETQNILKKKKIDVSTKKQLSRQCKIQYMGCTCSNRDLRYNRPSVWRGCKIISCPVDCLECIFTMEKCYLNLVRFLSCLNFWITKRYTIFFQWTHFPSMERFTTYFQCVHFSALGRFTGILVPFPGLYKSTQGCLTGW